MAILLVACSAESEPEEVEYTIEMTEFSYAPEDIELKVGQTVTLNLVNLGQLDHEIMIGREVKMDNSLPAGYELDMFEHAGVEPVVVMEMHENEHVEAEHEEAEDSHDEAEHEEAEDSHDEAEHEEAEDSHDEAEHEEDEHVQDEAEHEEGEDDHAETGHNHDGFMVSLANEDRATMTFTITEDMVGTWEIGCFLQDGAHYLADMKGSLVVEG
jgi:uncharacterized cupredoxin-like copper-binding protein